MGITDGGTGWCASGLPGNSSSKIQISNPEGNKNPSQSKQSIKSWTKSIWQRLFHLFNIDCIRGEKQQIVQLKVKAGSNLQNWGHSPQGFPARLLPTGFRRQEDFSKTSKQSNPNCMYFRWCILFMIFKWIAWVTEYNIVYSAWQGTDWFESARQK